MAHREPPADDRSVLGRALAVLETFSAEQREQTLGSIQQRAGLPSATTHRLVAELVEWGRWTALAGAGTGSGCGCGSSARWRPRPWSCATSPCPSCTTCST